MVERWIRQNVAGSSADAMCGQVLAQQVGSTGHVQTDVVALGLDPVDVLRSDKDAAVARGHDQPPQVAVIAAHVLQQRLQATVQIASLLLTDPLARALQRRAEALVVERLQQVVQRMRLEGAQGELVVGGHEDHHGHTTDADRLQHVEAVDLGHLNVQEEQIRWRLFEASRSRPCRSRIRR